MQESAQYDYTNTTGITLGLIGAFAVFVVLWEFGILAAFTEIDELERAIGVGIGFESWVATRRQALTGGLLLLSFVVAAATFLRWLYTMNRNSHALCAPGMQHGPRAAVAWFFAPGLSLSKPLEVLGELYRASDPDRIEDWKRADTPQLISLWWTLWLAFQATVVLALFADLWAQSMIQLQTAAWLSAVVGMIAPPLGVAASICVWRIHARQRARYRNTMPLRVRSPWPTRASEENEATA